MGKKGNLGLVLPKNSGSKEIVDEAIECIAKRGGQMPVSEFISVFQREMKAQGIGADETSIYHKTVMPRYFGLMKMEDSKYTLSEFGQDYYTAGTDAEKIRVIFDAISTITFGRDSEAVRSNSDVEAPLVFLKMLKDMVSVTTAQLGSVLFYLEAEGLSYPEAIARITSKDPSKEKDRIVGKGGGKFFDPKFPVFFEGLGIVKKDGHAYKLTAQTLKDYGDTIEEFVALNPKDRPAVVVKTPEEQKSVNEQFNDVMQKFLGLDTVPEAEYREQRERKPAPASGAIPQTGRNRKTNSFTQAQCFQLGWNGEAYVTKLLKQGTTALLNKLTFVAGEKITGIAWFNEGYAKDSAWEDKSVGRGYDILVETNKRKIRLEVKTSFNDVSYYSATTNELRAMADTGKDYYLVKVDNFKNIPATGKTPAITVIQNPIEALKSVNQIKDISFYI